MGSIVTPFNQLASALNRATATENHEIIGVVDHLVLEKLTPSGDPPVLRKRFMYRWASKLRGVSGKRAAHQEPTGGPTPQVGISRVARSRRHFYESAFITGQCLEWGAGGESGKAVFFFRSRLTLPGG